jgi:hypothetical protein
MLPNAHGQRRHRCIIDARALLNDLAAAGTIYAAFVPLRGCRRPEHSRVQLSPLDTMSCHKVHILDKDNI